MAELGNPEANGTAVLANNDISPAPAMPSVMTRFMYADGSPEPKGPALIPEIKRMLELGKINSETLVWTEGMESWQPLREVSLLQNLMLDAEGQNKAKSEIYAEESDEGEDDKDEVYAGQIGMERHEAMDEKKKKKKKKSKRKRTVTAVYVTNIPKDATENELATHFAKCGLIQSDPLTREVCIRIYKDDQGVPKGDATVVYSLAPSVENAVTILHEAELRIGHPETSLKVERATKQPAWAIDNHQGGASASDTMERALKLRRLEQDQALSWNEEGVEDHKGLRIIVIKNLFDPYSDEVRLDPSFKRDLEDDLMEECANFGDVKKVTVFDKHPEGVAIVRFLSARAAELCVERMNGRWFAKRKLSSEFWDGFTDFRKGIAEDEDRRLEAFASQFERNSDADEQPDEQ